MVVLLCGPPAAGKTTAANESGLTVYDRDDNQWINDQHFAAALRDLGQQPDARAVVIRAGASSTARAKTATAIGATHVHLLTAPRDELARRMTRRGRADLQITLAALNTWFKRHDQDDHVPPFLGWNALLPVSQPPGVMPSRKW